MYNPRLATRYAKSLIGLAIERNELEAVYADVNWLKSAIKGSRELLVLLRSPVVNPGTKKKIMAAVTGGQRSVLFNSFTDLLITKGRESNLPEVLDAFIAQYKTHKGIHIVKLTTAVNIDDATRSQILAQVRKSSGFDNIELEETVDPSIIGGFVLQMGDKLVDASVSYDLKAISRQFESNDFIYKVR